MGVPRRFGNAGDGLPAVPAVELPKGRGGLIGEKLHAAEHLVPDHNPEGPDV